MENNLYIMSLTYKKPLSDVQKYLEDSFFQNRIADYEIIEVLRTMYAKE